MQHTLGVMHSLTERQLYRAPWMMYMEYGRTRTQVVDICCVTAWVHPP